MLLPQKTDEKLEKNIGKEAIMRMDAGFPWDEGEDQG